jgi:N-acetylneuraminic acid mutarotase
VAGGTGYVAGGYDGARGSRQVLATRDGRHFRTVGRLPVPVRYAAVAFAGGGLLVLGGTAVSGPHAGSPVDLVQRLDPRTGRAAVVGHLPVPLQGAVAATLGDRVYVAGGSSSAATGASASRTVFRVDPTTHAVRRAGRLPLAVADAGIAVRGRRAWIIGGESAGRTRSAVQVLGLVAQQTGAR